MNDLDEACAYLQGIAGLTDGGATAQAFRDVTFDWSLALFREREVMVRQWLRLQAAHAEGN